MKNEKLTRKEIIDNRLKQAGWSVADRTQVIDGFDIHLTIRAVMESIESANANICWLWPQVPTKQKPVFLAYSVKRRLTKY